MVVEEEDDTLAHIHTASVKLFFSQKPIII